MLFSPTLESAYLLAIYPAGIKAWEFWDYDSKTVIISSHVQFDERVMPGNSVVALRQLFNTPPDLTSPDLSHQEGDVPSFDDSNGFMDGFMHSSPTPEVVEPPAAAVEPPPPIELPQPPVVPPLVPPSVPPAPRRELRPSRPTPSSLSYKTLVRNNVGPALSQEQRPLAPHPYQRPSASPTPSSSAPGSPAPFAAALPPASPDPDPIDFLGADLLKLTS